MTNTKTFLSSEHLNPRLDRRLMLMDVRFLCTHLLLRWVLASMLVIIMSLSLSWQSHQVRLLRLTHPRLPVHQPLRVRLQLQRLMQLLRRQCRGWWRLLPAWRPTEGCWESYPKDSAPHLGSTPPHRPVGSECTLWCRGNRTCWSEEDKKKRKC